MADTGSTQFPNGPRLDNKAGNTAVKTIFTASLIGVPNANKGAEDKIQHLKGTVINQNDKGQVRIQTEKGIVEVQLPKDSAGRNAPFKQGQRVDIEIPPQKVRGRSPDTVRIKTDAPPPEQTRHAKNTVNQTPQTTDASAQTKTSSLSSTSEPDAEVARTHTETRLNIQVQKPSLAQIPPSTSTANPETVKAQSTISLSKLAGETIRLDPLPPNLSVQLITPHIEILPQAISQQALDALSASVQLDNQSQQAQDLLNITKPTTAQALPILNQPEITTAQGQKSIINQIISEQIKPVLFTFFEPAGQIGPPILSGSGDTIQFNQVAPKPIDLLRFSASITIIPGSIKSIDGLKPQQSAPAPIQAGSALVAQIENIKPPQLFLVAPPSADKPSNALPNLPPPTTPIDMKSIILEGYQPSTIIAQIIGKTEASLPVVSITGTPESFSQNFILQVPAHDIITGSQIEITPQSTLSTPALTTGVAQMTLPAPGYFLIPGQWPLMEDILQSVQQSSALVAQAVSSSIPNAAAPAQMTPAALFFIAALRAGDLSGILGERAQQILRGQGKGGLLSRLSLEGSILNRTEQTPSSDWRSLTLPMAWENEIQKIVLHYKHDHPDATDQDKGQKQTRFIFDLSLTRMGKVQLDGLHRGERLNIIMRTETPMSQAMQATMKQAYHNSLATTELSGDLSFQNNLDGWVKIAAEEKSEYQSSI